MNTTWITIMAAAAHLIPDGVFDRIKGAVERWDDKVDPDGRPYSGDEKRSNVEDELELIGIKLAQFTAFLLIGLAVAVVRVEQGRPLLKED
jgi:uncharacterized ion transporter superfamily protein YfcC